MERIAVVGAGIAGLTAARALVAAGRHVVVFETSHEPGGRVATWHVPNVELPRMGTVDLAFDHGAQYFTVRDPRFAAVVDRWVRDRLVAKWTGKIVSFDDEGWEDVALGTDRYVAVPGMSALGAYLARDLDVRYGVRVESFEKMAEFDRVILAVPPAQAVPLLADAPALAARVAAVPMKPCWAALAAFEAPVPSRFDAAFVSHSPLGWIARNQSKPRRALIETWVLHATTEWSAAHRQDRPDTVGPFLLAAFADLVRGGLPKPFYLTAHWWRAALADPPLSVGALHDAERHLTVCGDWCAGSRVEGAFASGLAAATPE